MDGSSFDLIAQEIINQKLIMEQMEEENRELHRQLADLCDGRGIFVDIGGQRFALLGQTAPRETTHSYREEMAEAALEAVPTEVEAEQEVAIEADESEEAVLYDYESNEYESAEYQVDEAPTQALPEIVDRPTQPGREMPVPAESFLVEDEAPMPSFLEELMIDEFATVTRNPKAVWSAPEAQPQKAGLSDEETKAALRRELIGSFLLE